MGRKRCVMCHNSSNSNRMLWMILLVCAKFYSGSIESMFFPIKNNWVPALHIFPSSDSHAEVAMVLR